jgi:hypothetical protein
MPDTKLAEMASTTPKNAALIRVTQETSDLHENRDLDRNLLQAAWFLPNAGAPTHRMSRTILQGQRERSTRMAMCRGVLPTFAAMTAALTVWAVPAAQGQQQPRPPQSQTQQSAVSDKEIQAFASAASEVRQLNQKWVPQVQAAAQQGPDAEQKVRQQAMAEMTQAVQKKGLSVDRYSTILDQAQTDPELNRKVQERMQPKQ